MWAEYNGPLGDGTNIDKSFAVQVIGLNEVIQAAGGGEYSLFLKNDGTVWACGLNASGQLGDGTNVSKNVPSQIIGLSDIIQVASGAICLTRWIFQTGQAPTAFSTAWTESPKNMR